jgi:hypothetical protein
LGQGFILILMIAFCFAVYISFCWDVKVVLWWEMWLCYLMASGCICTWWVVILISLYSTHCSQLSLCYAWGNRSRLYMCQQSSLLQLSFVLHWLPLFPWRYDPSQFLL